MGRFADIARIKQQGLDENTRQFIESTLAALVHTNALNMGCQREIDWQMKDCYATEAGLLWAVNQPVSLAAVIDDVARWLGVTSPEPVRIALGDDPHAA